MLIDNMTGLEIMQAMVQGSIPHPSITKTFPMKCVLAKKGKIIFQVKADERHLNPLGGVHGGFSATVMDSVTGCVVHTMLDAKVGYATVDLNVKMLKPVPRDTKLIAEGTIIKVSKSLGVSEGTLKDEAGKLYAHSTATCMIFDV
ncbi:MAG: PaaI family thioesterase [Proteobacteria bacterium]|nr:PaaI family thioesterase [Pseudomonadota bacterium]